MKRWLLAGAVVIAVLAVVIWRDPTVTRLVSSAAPRSALVAPDYVQTFADAFCRADAKYLAANSQIPGGTEQVIADYFAGDPACTGVRYLGAVNDAGTQRFVFVLSFGERQDWLVYEFSDRVVTHFKRG